MHHFAGLPLGAVACVYLRITHQSFFFLAGSWGPVGRGGEGGGGVPAAPALWPLTAPSNERRHSYTDALTLCWSPCISLPSPQPLSPSRQSAQAVHQGTSPSFPCADFFSVLSPLPLVSSVSGSLTSTHPHLPSFLPSSPRLLLWALNTLQKTAIRKTFLLVMLEKLYSTTQRLGCTQNINHVLLCRIPNVIHSGAVIINSSREFCRLLKSAHALLRICIPDCSSYHKSYRVQTPTSLLGINQIWKWPI